MFPFAAGSYLSSRVFEVKYKYKYKYKYEKTLFLAAALLCSSLSQGATLLHHWDFNGGDLSDKVTNNPDWAMTGKAGNKGDVSNITYPSSTITTGSGDYGDNVTFAGNFETGTFLETGGDLNVTSSFSMTIMGWVNPAARTDASLFGVGGGGEGFKIALDSGKLKFTTKNVADFAKIGEKELTLNAWSHIAVSITRADDDWVIDYFVNGVLHGQDVQTGKGMNSNDLAGFTIGSGGKTPQELRASSYDDVKIYDGTMSADEIKVAMGAGAAVPEPTTASLGLLGLTALLLRRRRLA